MSHPPLPGIWRRLRRAATAAVLVALPATGLSAQTPAEIVDHVDRLLRGASSEGRLTMRITTRQWTRSLDLRIWSLGTDYALVQVLAPEREAGTATLKAATDVWNYLPRVDRTIKIPPSLMMGSWLGSHFTNDDLVKESRMVDDYDVTLSFDGTRDSVAVWELTLVPKPDAAVVWGKVVERVRKRDQMPLWARYYDDAGHLARTLTFDDFAVMGGRLVPARLTVV
ncbi:MAG TPA: outer membrane lipoprotein-sorting protein, partial [Gemmatimonadales bacterium]|nr:outer membrane lipoprotein-sorting protein [Gemmatimonadales bacterium]